MGALVLVLATVEVAEAQGRGTETRTSRAATVAVDGFRGPAHGRMRAAVIQALSSEGIGIAEGGGEAAARIDGEVRRRGRRYVVTVWVRSVADGSILAAAEMRGRGVNGASAALRRHAYEEIGGVIRGAALPADLSGYHDAEVPPEHDRMSLDQATSDLVPERSESLDPELYPEQRAAMDDEDAEDADDALDRDDFRPAYRPLTLGSGIRLFNRGFTYVDDQSGTTKDYALPLGPELVLSGEWFPGAHFTNGALAHVGLTARLSRSLALDSAGPENTTYITTDTDWAVGAIGRLPLGRHEVRALATYGHHEFAVESEHPRDPAPSIASVNYQHAKLGADARIALGAAAVYAGAAWLAVFDAGEIGDAAFFPGTTATGVQGAVGFGYALSDTIELRGDVDVRMYFLDFNPASDATTMVEGAIDRYIAGTIGVTWQMDPTGLGGAEPSIGLRAGVTDDEAAQNL